MYLPRGGIYQRSFLETGTSVKKKLKKIRPQNSGPSPNFEISTFEMATNQVETETNIEPVLVAATMDDGSVNMRPGLQIGTAPSPPRRRRITRSTTVANKKPKLTKAQRKLEMTLVGSPESASSSSASASPPLVLDATPPPATPPHPHVRNICVYSPIPPTSIEVCEAFIRFYMAQKTLLQAQAAAAIVLSSSESTPDHATRVSSQPE
jgi:hypothetical protein